MSQRRPASSLRVARHLSLSGVAFVYRIISKNDFLRAYLLLTPLWFCWSDSHSFADASSVINIAIALFFCMFYLN